MKTKGKKRFLAPLLALCLILSDGSFAGTMVSEASTIEPTAAGTGYTFEFKTTVGKGDNQKDVTCKDAAVKVYEMVVNGEVTNKIEVEAKDGSFDLKQGSKYSYTVTDARYKDVTGEFTVNETTATNMVIPVSIGNVNLVMPAESCYEGESIDLFKTGDLDFDWKWTSSDETVAKVDSATGEVTTLKPGKVKITKASNVDANIKGEADITVNGLVKCSLKFKEGSGTNQQDLGDIDVEVKHGDNIISPNDKGIYKLLPETEYSYTITTTGITEETKSGTFTTDAYVNETTVEVLLSVKLVEPEFQINDIEIAGIEKIKSGTGITLKCQNFDKLYKKDDWKYTVNSGSEIKLESSNSITCNGTTVTISYKYGTHTGEICSVPTFDEYKFVPYYKDGDKNIEIKDLTGSSFSVKRWWEPIEIKDMEAGKSYTVDVNVNGFKLNENVSVNTVFNEETISVQVGTIIVPTVTAETITVGCGKVLSMTEFTFDDSKCCQNPKFKWDWTYAKSENPDQREPVGEDNEVTLNSEGTYLFTCGYKNVRSVNSVTVNVEKTVLGIDWSKWTGQKRVYDGTNKFTITMPISSDALTMEDKTNHSIGDDDALVIEGTVSSANVGEYDKINITSVSVTGAENNYDITSLKKSLENKEKSFDKKMLIIEQAVIDATVQQIRLQYRTHKIHPYEDKINFSPNIKESYLEKEIYQLMGIAKLKDDKKCSFPDVTYDSTKNEYFVNTLNINTMFNNFSVDSDLKVPVFDYTIVSEMLQDPNILNQIIFTQDTVDLNNNDWVNGNDITAAIKTGAYTAEGAYNAVTFSSMSDVTDWGQLKEKAENGGITEAAGKTGNNKISGNVKEETYYEVFFTRDTEGWQYSTPVAILRIVPEDQEKEDKKETKDKVMDKKYGGEYPVITFYSDTTPDEIVFDNSSLERLGNASDITLGTCCPTEIGFSIVGNGFEVKDVKYAFIKLNQSEGRINEEELVIPAEKDLTVLKPDGVNKFSVTCPEEDGDYVFYVLTRNKGNYSKSTISNGFIVDSKAPILTPVVKKVEEKKTEDVSKDVAKKGKICSSGSVNFVLNIDEPHIKDVKVEILAEKKNGNIIDLNENPATDMAADLTGKAKKTEYTFKQSGNYTVNVRAEDKAGHFTNSVYYFTVDNCKPEEGEILVKGSFHNVKQDEEKAKGKAELLLEEFQQSWNKFLANVTYNIFSQKEISVTLSGSDSITDAEIYYYISDKEMTEAELKKLSKESWNTYSEEEGKKPGIKVNREAVLYEKVTDKAGNSSYFNSEGMITDSQAPEVLVTFGKEANANGFYKEAVAFTAKVEDKIPEGALSASGLQYVAYRIEKDGKNTESKVLYDAGTNKDKNMTQYTVENKKIDGKQFNSNDVVLYVTAVDNAGNKTEAKQELTIDTVKPEISVVYEDGQDGTYFNHDRTAVVTIKERNLNTKDVAIIAEGKHGSRAVVGKWSSSSEAGKSDEAERSCKITFKEDDDYKFSVSCVDKAGNAADKTFSDEFTVDKTNPAIEVSYNGGAPEQNAFYNTEVTAVITIKEHNFKAEKAVIQTKAGEGSEGGQQVSSFESNGDVHTATVHYNADGEYGLEVSYTDEAGNAAVSYTGNSFTVDMTEPELSISNVEDRSANKEEVKPVITYTDKNYDKEKVEIHVTGANGGEKDLQKTGYAAAGLENGERIQLDFPKTEEMDDMYVLTAKVTDKAGNTKEESIEFSVNRYGSVYTLGKETLEWMANGECAYIKEERPVVIIETNVDEVTERNISYTAGGMDASIIQVEEKNKSSEEEKAQGRYYESREESNGNGWHQYRYEIGAGNFAEEGKYTIQIDSTDAAGNHTGNVGNRHEGGKLNVKFAVDRTAPTAVMTGIEDGKIYNESEHTAYVDVQDNLGLKQVKVYVDGTEYGSFKAEEIEKLEGGMIPVTVKESLNSRKIEVEAEDYAGNRLGEKATGKYDSKAKECKILVTRNPFVRFLHSIGIWILLAGMLATAAVVVIVVKRKKVNK